MNWAIGIIIIFLSLALMVNFIGWRIRVKEWKEQKKQMDFNDIRTGINVKVANLGDTKGMIINQRHLDVRKVGITGVVMEYVPGHGGDVWWVKHDNSDDIGAYSFTELEPEDVKLRDPAMLPGGIGYRLVDAAFKVLKRTGLKK